MRFFEEGDIVINRKTNSVFVVTMADKRKSVAWRGVSWSKDYHGGMVLGDENLEDYLIVGRFDIQEMYDRMKAVANLAERCFNLEKTEEEGRMFWERVTTRILFMKSEIPFPAMIIKVYGMDNYFDALDWAANMVFPSDEIVEKIANILRIPKEYLTGEISGEDLKGWLI